MSRIPARRLVLLLPLLLAARVAGADREHPPAHYVPADMPIVVTVTNGDQHTSAFRAMLEATRFTDSPTWRGIMADPGIQKTRIDLMGLAAAAQTDVWTALGALLGRDLVLGIGPGPGDDASFVLAVTARDDATVGRLLATIHEVAGLEVAGRPDEGRTFDVRGTRVYRFDDELLQCRVGSVLILTNRRSLMEAALAGDDALRLESAEWYGAARTRVPETAAVWASARREAFIAAVGPYELPSRLSNPLAGFLFGGWWNFLRSTDELVVWAEPVPSALRVHLETSPVDAAHGPLPGFLPAKTVTVDPLDTTDAAASLQLHRGWAQLFGDREALLTEAAVSNLTNFTGTLTTLMGGVDFVDEVMENVAGPIQLILARQDFDDLGVDPTPKLPAFALVIPLDVDDQAMLRRRLDSAALTAASIINADDGRDGPGYLIDIEPYREQRVMMMSLAPVERRDDAMLATRTMGVRYNFAPAASLVGNRYVIATSAPLMHSVIDAALDGTTKPDGVEAAYDALRIDAGAVLAMLRDNREELVTDRMLEEDQARDDAARDVDAILGALEFVDSLSLSAHTDADGGEATLVLTLREPAETE